ncbi:MULTISPECIES: hypothetical protein [unclassified Saccharicrinis]|uniref:hypothetical protein n=1 Tax=unclassified Saccharicrinis TaxID=2646859 RepID=UPI003D33850A
MSITGESKIGLLILSIIICASCAREAYNISLNGVIVDEETNCPVPLSSVRCYCLYQHNIDESATQKLDTHTDSLGQYQLKFNKGYKITMSIEAKDYVDKFVQFKPYNGHTPDTIYLKRKLVFQTSAASPTTIQQ